MTDTLNDKQISGTESLKLEDNLPELVRVFVNERGVSVPRYSTVLTAVALYSGALADAVAAGTARVTDSRGLPLAPEVVVNGGTILRVVPVRNHVEENYP